MDIFKEVRERANILEVCDVLGIKLNKNHKAICPFADHNEKTASFSISPSKNIFCCFGCGKKGNSITLVQKLLNISPLESAKYINYHLHLGLDAERPSNYLEINKYKQKRKTEQKFKEWELQTFILLTDYLHILWKWEREEKPKQPEDEVSDLFVEALQQKDYIEYIIDSIFIEGTNEDKIWFWKHEKKIINRIRNKMSTLKIE